MIPCSMKLSLCLFLISHDMDIKKTGCTNILLLKHHRRLLPLSYVSFWFMEWQSPRFTESSARYHYWWSDWASRLCSLGPDLWGELCKVGHCGQDMAWHTLGKRLQGDIPSFGYARQRHPLSEVKGRVSVVTVPAIFRFRWDLRNKLWEWWFES